MKIFLNILLLFCTATIWSQPKMDMTPQGFAPIELSTPNLEPEKLIQKSKSWAAFYNITGYDVYNVTENSLMIDAMAENAYFYRNLGETFSYNIKYTLKIVFKKDKTYSLGFSVKEIYAKEVLTKTTIADFFTPSGKLKGDFTEVKPSLENTVNSIVKSYDAFLKN